MAYGPQNATRTFLILQHESSRQRHWRHAHPEAVWLSSHACGENRQSRRIARRRMHIEHVNSSIKRCDIVHDTSRLRQAGVRKGLAEVCCALRSFRVRRTPWQLLVWLECTLFNM
jgi:hypothetical protein